ncbi:MAG: YajQ family cyclic di-GMP-binding protein [Gammaproteobacteria bacterium]|nr:YajQ family cyclic di-GMP-binding protein [Gammaproteobacteria bacterium]
MPSFDVVSEVDMQEVRNAVDQANREVGTRFDFKGVGAKFDLSDSNITVQAEQEFQLDQMMDILRQKLVKRKVDIACLETGEPEIALNKASLKASIRQGIKGDIAKRMVKEIKATKIKVQTQIQGEQVRITGKKRDDLQTVITTLKKLNFDLPLQFINFRD